MVRYMLESELVNPYVSVVSLVVPAFFDPRTTMSEPMGLAKAAKGLTVTCWDGVQGSACFGPIGFKPWSLESNSSKVKDRHPTFKGRLLWPVLKAGVQLHKPRKPAWLLLHTP